MVDERADDAFASIAVGLLRSGVHSVVAMAFELNVSGAQEFLPAFYRRLFASGDVAEATLAGRQQMLAENGRVCARGTFPLDDWLVPVLYQQQPLDFSFAKEVKAEEPAALPSELVDQQNPYGLIGRDGTVLEMERALRRPPAGILVHGLGGVGKTTLALGFARWLIETGGLAPKRLFWFRFDEIRSAEFVINRLGEVIYGDNFSLDPMEDRLAALTKGLGEEKYTGLTKLSMTFLLPAFSKATSSLLPSAPVTRP